MSDLSNIGTGDFTVSFTLQTTQTDSSIALLSQRGSCSAANFWEIRIQNNVLVVETNDVSSGNANDVSYTGCTTLNDGKAHAIVVQRVSSALSVYINGVYASPMVTSTANWAQLPALSNGTDACVGVDGTVTFDTSKGSITNVCLQTTAQAQADGGASCGGGGLANGYSCAQGSDCLSGVCNGGSCDDAIAGLSARWGHACGFRTPGNLKCWGINSSGELGLGDTSARGGSANQMGTNLPYVQLGTGRTVQQVASGGHFTCAILDDGSVKCWGKNDQGDLGLGDTENRGDQANEMGDSLPTVSLGTGRTAKTIAGGDQHACAILDDGSLKCWGYNADGELGLGDTNNRGDQANEMGDNLPAVSLGTGRSAVALALGAVDTCVLLDDASVKCWGYNYGAGGAPSTMGDNLAPLSLGTGLTVQALSPGASHMCALFTSGQVKCWGYDIDGRLGIGSTGSNYFSASSLGDNLPFVSLSSTHKAVAINTQSNSACATLDDSSVKCWGWNNDGNLGIGDTTLRGATASQMGDNLPTVDMGTGRHAVSLWPMGGGACVVLDDGDFKCWGQNNYGQLGLGDTNNRGVSAGQMGDSLPAVAW